MRTESHRRVTLAEAKDHLSDLLAVVEAGETVEITRHSVVVATVSPPRRPVDFAGLRRLTDSMPCGAVAAGGVTNPMRDCSRY